MSPTTDPQPTAPNSRYEPTEEDWVIWRDYFRGARELIAALDRRLQDDAGISHPEFLVLVALARAPQHQLRTGELAVGLSWEKSRVSHQVTRMAKRGLVARKECPDDARGVWVVLTAHGAKLFERAGIDHGDAIAEMFFEVLTRDELEVVHAASRRIRERLRALGAAQPSDDSLPLPTEVTAPAAS